jgi:hypothetical protein
MKNNAQKGIRGFTLIESVVSIGVFMILLMAIYNVTAQIIHLTKNYRENIVIAGLAAQYSELVRNLPYAQIGTESGNPHGNLPDLPNAIITTIDAIPYRVYYEVTYTDDPADGTILLGTDVAANDYKQVKINITNQLTGATRSFLTNISPKNLEGTTSSGALFLKVFDSVGQPIPGATINITNTAVSPSINLTRTTNSSGNWIEVGLPNSATSYHITASQTGKSSDQTYPSILSNPNPIKPDATIINGQVTQISFSIDKVSSLLLKTLDQSCLPISDVGVRIKGAKLIGTPSVLKFDSTYTSDTNGLVSLPSIEWDTYTPSLTGTTYMIYGSSPIQQVNILPNTAQTFTLILGPKTNHSLLVIVKDAATGNPIEGADVDLRTTSPTTHNHKTTGGSVWSQQDWTGGAGQTTIGDPTRYFDNNGNISTQEIPSAVRLSSFDSSYAPFGTFTSSTFDTGTASSSYTTFDWQPTSQDPSTSIRFQIATNNDNATWNFIGPDGTADSLYGVPGNSLSSTHNNNRYIRYRAFLTTLEPSKTPVLTSTSLNYISGCYTPGQVMYAGLSSGSDYELVVSAAGHATQTISDLNISGYNILQVLLN